MRVKLEQIQLGRVFQLGLGVLILALAACGDRSWNNPYPAADSDSKILYGSFSERPKHLDPVRSYSSNEYQFIGQIYEPPLQYHFLKRPYQLAPLTTQGMPKLVLLDKEERPLPDTAPAGEVAFSEYVIDIQPDIRYQPHPALAKGENGQFVYHQLAPEVLEEVNTLADFPRLGNRELRAEDYVYQIKRMAFSPLHSPIGGVMAEYIVGFADYSKRLDEVYAKLRKDTGRERPYLDLNQYPLEGVRAEGKYRYRIRLKGKYPQFLYWLAMPFFAPMPWEADRFYSQPGMKERNISLNWYPVGTGPFMLAENNPNLRMVLERNPNFHGEIYPTEGEPTDQPEGLLADAGKPLPLIDRAIYSLERETIPYWNKFLQGFYDVSGISSDSFDQAIQFDSQGEVGLTEQMAEKGIKLVTAIQTSSYYMGFNMRDSAIGWADGAEQNRLLRRAIAIAVDYEEFISIFSNGRGIPAQGPLPPGIFGYREGEAGINPYVYDNVDGQPRRKSIEEAKQLMVQAGYPGGRDQKTGKPLALHYEAVASGPDDKARLNWTRKQFEKLGIQLVIRATDYNRFQEKMRKGTGQIFSWGWNADYPDPENFLFLLHGPNSKVESSGENAANYANPDFDRLFEKMKNMDNSPERQAIIDEMVELARRDSPWLFGFHPKGFSLHHDWYANVKPNLMANNTLKYKRLVPELRDQKRREWNPPILWPVILVLILLLASAIPAYVTYKRRERSAAL